MIGRPITAYYDPKNISHVTLVRGARHSKYVMLFLKDAVLAIAAPLLYGLFFLARKKRLLRENL